MPEPEKPASEAYIVCIECGHRHATRPSDDICTSCGKRFVLDVAAPETAEVARALLGEPRSRRQRLAWLVPFALAVLAGAVLLYSMRLSRHPADGRRGLRLEALGGLTKNVTAELVAAIASHRPELQKCLVVPDARPPATVDVDLHWRIELDGSVSGVTVSYTSWTEPAFVGCAVTTVGSWQLGPRPTPVAVDYPFVLEAASP